MHRPRPPHRPSRYRERISVRGASSEPRGVLRRVVIVLSALACVVGVAVAPAISASAAPMANASVAAAHVTAAHHASATVSSPPKSGSLMKSRLGRLLASSVKPVCSKPKRGYAACMSLLRTNVKPHKGLFVHDTAPSGYGPADLQSAYNLPSATAGSGKTVAIVDAGDDPTAAADLATYRSQYGLPACTTANGCFEKVNQSGQQGSYPPVDSTWPVEESLDIDMVSAICPSCHILLVEANSASATDLGAAEDEAVSLGASYVSNSYGLPEQELGSASAEAGYDKYYNHPGVVITAAGGDYGYGNYLEGADSPNFPATSQYVTSVGGTSLTRDSSTSRGWAETAWSPDPGATGSGCSLYEPKPAWQQDTGCTNRMTNDVSAVADPQTGVAIYDTTGEGGWLEVGGTSVATPIIASVYALAGAPQAGSNPASYPYLHSSNGTTTPPGMNDVTSGTNYDSSCTPSYFCTAGTGYDGPTGLGTPDGVSDFAPVSAGTVSGTVTDTATGKPLAGATVTVGGFTVTTGSGGGYSVTVATGTYTMMAQAYGYAEKTVTGVAVTKGQTTAENFALTAVPHVTLSGTVTDGSGHKWPLHAKITLSGTPLAPVYSSPFSGQYSISVPAQASYTLQVSPLHSGYAATNVTVNVGVSNTTQDITVPVAAYPACTSAPGYKNRLGGIYETFDSWTGTTPKDGWSVVDASGTSKGWEFDNPGNEGNYTGGSGNFATADPYDNGGVSEDTSLVSPVVNLSKVTSPQITFDTLLLAASSYTADVDLSLDGGTTWQTVWQRNASGYAALGLQTIPIPQAAGQSDVQVRFSFTGEGEVVWQVDNVLVGVQDCALVPGGLVAGTVTDANTSSPVNGVTVATAGTPTQSAATAATSDPAVPGGFYDMFVPHTGNVGFTASGAGYAAATAKVSVTANAVTRQDWALKAGKLAVSPGSVSATQVLGGSVTKTVTLTNDGSAAEDVALAAQATGTGSPGSTTQPRAAAGGASWANLPARPDGASGSVLASWDDNVYSVGGLMHPIHGSPTLPTVSSYVYSAAAGKWSPIAPLPQPLWGAAGGFIGGTLYVAGGFTPTDQSMYDVVPVAATYAYNPLANTWTQVASLPQPLAWAGAAVLGGQLYLVGGCPYNADISLNCIGLNSRHIQTVYRYDPASNTWTRRADYPVPISQEACAGIDGEVACAGGFYDYGDAGIESQQLAAQARVSTYIYHPAVNTWSRGADMPYGAAEMAYSAAGGDLVVATGVTGSSLGGVPLWKATRRAAAYDPVSNIWATLPDVKQAAPPSGGQSALPPFAYASGACGFYLAGVGKAEHLPGLGGCTAGVPWLSTNTQTLSLAPGKSVTVAVTLDSAQVSQPGTYTAQLWVTADSPYDVIKPVTVTMHVTPPPGWGKVTGMVTGVASGQPVAWAATVLACGYDPHTGGCGGTQYPLQVDGKGFYQRWVNGKNGPLLVSVAKDGYQPQARLVTIKPGATTTVNFALREDPNQ